MSIHMLVILYLMLEREKNLWKLILQFVKDQVNMLLENEKIGETKREAAESWFSLKWFCEQFNP